MIVSIPKTEICLFSRKPLPGFSLNLKGTKINSKPSMKILGIIFDSQLTWDKHVEKVIKAAKTSCYGLNHLRKFFTQEEMINIATALAYSKLYYGSLVWLGPMTHRLYKKRLKAASVGIIRSALNLYEWNLSYDDLHEVAGRGTPEQMAQYQHALAYYDLFNSRIPHSIWHTCDQKKLTNERNNFQLIPQTNKTKIGLNSLDNRLNHITKLIPTTHLSLTKQSFKSFAKRKFLS